MAQFEAVRELLLVEGEALDDQRWDDWLNLYTNDCLFWVPAWDDDHVLTTDPSNEISLIYLDGKERLEERVWRIRSGLSSSLIRQPRTCHLVSNIRVTETQDSTLSVRANFHVDAFKLDELRLDYFFGHYFYQLVEEDGALKIKQKKIVVKNDLIPRQMDIFSV